MSTSYQFDLLRTYRFVRLAMVLLVLLLFISVASYIASSSDHMLQSISASYYTPVKAVFVSSLCAIGTCLIVYQGSTELEDVLLNGSGFFAFIVAFVPTRPEQNCVATRSTDVRDAITNNVSALFFVAVLAFVVVMGIQFFATPRPNAPCPRTPGSPWLLGAGVPGPGGFYPFNRGGFMCHGHNTRRSCSSSASSRRLRHARGLAREQASQDGRPVRAHRWNRYFWGFVLMAASIATIAVTGPWLGWLDHWVFWLEAALIGQFATFWLAPDRSTRGANPGGRTPTPVPPPPARLEPMPDRLVAS